MSKLLDIQVPNNNLRFTYFQHTPSPNETIIPCLQAKQTGISLDPLIQSGGISLCDLMGYATSNSSSNDATSKQFPPYLNFLLGTAYPIEQSTIPLAKTDELLATFALPAMDPTIQNLGYKGYGDFLTRYLLEQGSKHYSACGGAEICPSIYYLPYQSTETNLIAWPPRTDYGMSGGGGGSQFSTCYVSPTQGNLNGLGLGSGLGSGLSAQENIPIIYEAPPAADYSYYAPSTHPSWSHSDILAAYGSNLTERE